MTNKEKLNKKLAKWANFKPTYKGWIPPFHDDIEFCFIHLIPKLLELHYDYKLFSDAEMHFCNITKDCYTLTGNKTDNIVSSPGTETPSEAICLAIEILIGKK